MLVVLLILIPLLFGLGAFFVKSEGLVKTVALLSSIITMGIALFALRYANNSEQLVYSKTWLGAMGANFSFAVDGIGRITTLLNAISFPIIFIAT